MKDILELKADFLSTFHNGIRLEAKRIAASSATREEKAKQVNKILSSLRRQIADKITTVPIPERPNYAMILQYCSSVASIEYRHFVWPYEFMAFSRRVGELWEDFCSAAWDYPSRPRVSRILAPGFSTVRESVANRLTNNVGDHAKKDELLVDINLLFEIIGDINMREDEVFSVDDVPHVIDFKSGFGSNEKGNMLRLLSVGKAYKVWNLNTRLMLLVRQEQNNNYLNVLRRQGLWEVHTGAAAYEQISIITGANVSPIRQAVVNWSHDLSEQLYKYLLTENLTSYLDW